jgi:hypothetical protein
MWILGYRKGSCWFPHLLTGTEEHKTAGNCSPIHLIVRIWPHHTTTCSGPWKITWEVTHYETDAVQEAVRSWLRGAGTAEVFLRFCNTGRNT